MKILHIFDHSLPLHSGYTFRSRALLTQQHNMGYQTCHVTSPKHPHSDNAIEQADGLSFYRTKPYSSWFWRLPVLKELAVVLALKQRILEVIQLEQPAVLHAHSPALNGLAALWATKQAKLPVVYEIRAFWEDAAVGNRTGREGSAKYRLTRMLENHVVRHADAVFTICEGLRDDLVARGFSPDKIGISPNAVDLTQFGEPPPRDDALAAQLGLTVGPVIGFIGSFYPYEGLDDLVAALHARAAEGATLGDCADMLGDNPAQTFQIAMLAFASGKLLDRRPTDQITAAEDGCDSFNMAMLRRLQRGETAPGLVSPVIGSPIQVQEEAHRAALAEGEPGPDLARRLRVLGVA